MSLKLGTGKTRTFSVCLQEELYAELVAVAKPLRVGQYIRLLVGAALADESEGVDTKREMLNDNWTVSS